MRDNPGVYVKSNLFIMKAPEYVINKIEKLEGKLKTLTLLTTRQASKQDFQNSIKESEEILQDVKDAIQREINNRCN